MTNEVTAMDDLIEEVSEMLEWSRQETRNFLYCFVSDSPDGLQADLIAACEWARQAETMAALISTMKQSPPGLFEAKWLHDSEEVALRINPDIRPEEKKMFRNE